MFHLQNKHILLGITGGIAAHKSAELIRLLKKDCADVRVVMTQAAKAFITPITLQSLSGHPVHHELFEERTEKTIKHIELARWADVVLVAPTSANFIARLAYGFASDLLSTLCLATTATIAVAPAMNHEMWNHTATQKNVQALKDRNVHIFGPASGKQACGEIGFGRMLEPEDILLKTIALFQAGCLTDKNVLITAGPTREAIDPIRYISNMSSGKMGFALAEAAAASGAKVTLIGGPVNLETPNNVERIDIITAQEMYHAVTESIKNIDVFIAAAAVSDYRCKKTNPQKIKSEQKTLTMEFIKNSDILAHVANLPNRPYIVGFAAESENLTSYAKQKLKKKKLVLRQIKKLGLYYSTSFS